MNTRMKFARAVVGTGIISRRVVFRRDLQDFSMENRRYRSMGGWGKAPVILLHLLPYLLKKQSC